MVKPDPGPSADPLFHVVLHEPEIPNNTGNIGRTCVATGCALHLIHPLGFDTSEKACRRAGLDYWPRLDVRHHDSWERYVEAERPGASAPAAARAGGGGTVGAVGAGGAGRMWLLTTKSKRLVFEADLRPGDHLVFGKETAGLPGELLERYGECAVALPLAAEERSLNLATAVCAVVYEGVRQALSHGLVGLDANGKLTRGVNTRYRGL